MTGRDMYADLEKIEARGKRKKEKQKKGGFSLFGKRANTDTQEPVSEPAPSPKPEAPPPSESDMVELVESRESPESDGPLETDRSEQSPVSEDASAPEQEPQAKEERSDMPDDVHALIPRLPGDEPRAPKKIGSKQAEPEPAPEPPNEEKGGPKLQDSRFYKRDIYAAFDEIEQRGKRKKEKRSFTFIKKDEPAVDDEEEAAPVIELVVEETSPEPVPEPVAEETMPEPSLEHDPAPETVEEIETEPVLLEAPIKPLPETEPASGPLPEPEPVPEPEEFAVEEVPESVEEPEPEPMPEEVPEPEPEPQWEPLSGRKLHKAEDDLLEYKRKLDKGFKSGKLTRDQCVSMVKKKEIELGLRPDEDS